MPTKRKNGKFCKCYWCGLLPRWNHKHTYTHTNINNDPPVKYFCSKKCLELWTFRENHRIIIGFTNHIEQLYIKHNFIYKNE